MVLLRQNGYITAVDASQLRGITLCSLLGHLDLKLLASTSCDACLTLHSLPLKLLAHPLNLTWHHPGSIVRNG